MQYIEAANHFAGREGCTPRFLVLHGTAGGTSALAIADFFAGQAKDPNTGSSANYVIGTAGEVVQCVLDTDAPWANGPIMGPASNQYNHTGYGNGYHDAFWDQLGVNPNLVTIAIEHCKPSTDNSDSLTAAQQKASFALIEQLCDKWGIPKRWADQNGGITGHFSTDPVNRARCPGPYPWDALFAYLGSNQSSPAPAPAPAPTPQGDDMLQITDPFARIYFKQLPDGRWQCNNGGQIVQGAILNFFRLIGGAVRLPQTPEMHTIKDVVWQRFESGIIVYDPKHLLDHPITVGDGNCYVVKLDSDLAKTVLVKPYVDAANAAVKAAADAQAQVKALNLQVADLMNKLKASSSPDQTALKNALAAAQNLEKALQPFVK